jgi:hypothetical protein
VAASRFGLLAVTEVLISNDVLHCLSQLDTLQLLTDSPETNEWEKPLTDNSSVHVALLPRRDKEAILKALAAELGYILHPATGTIRIFQQDYIIARVLPQSVCVPHLLQFPLQGHEKQFRQQRVPSDSDLQ